ncbi:M4 family metallopeptidase [Streptomyces iconiensis]|uniref:M4 family metallopeptidase n=1 Tax=Streptomyces iconiensis TaxID=1384038 RepID=A0ABT6ZW95_9ACTN|nr:M4 family metallopeptidase [Streptomyces iconiensis]MDJ1133330.1 M4 family metallopeptidase [Streptomyces iconiensis]
MFRHRRSSPSSPSLQTKGPRAAAAWAAAALVVSLTVPQALAGPLGSGSTAAEPDPLPGKIAGQGTAAPRMVTGLDDAAPGATATEAARTYLDENRDRYHVAADDGALLTLGTEGSTVRFQQLHHGVPVLGAHYLVHLSGKGAAREVTGVGGAYYTELAAPTRATVAAKRSAAIARTTLKDPRQRAAATVRDRGLVVLPDGALSQAASPDGAASADEGRLARHHTVRVLSGGEPVVREVYVDARKGAVVLSYDTVRPAETPAKATGKDVRGEAVTFDAARQDDGTYRMSDLTRGSRIDTYDAGGRNYTDFLGKMPAGMAPVSSPTAAYPESAGQSGAVNAHLNSARVYDFYKSELGRDGIDGKGGTITSVVNVSAGGGPYANAFWDGQKMVYGGGGDYHSFAAALDVAGHEMTHGVIERSADLLYMNQSGAMNEAIADYFGNAIEVEAKGTPMSDPAAGLVGEDLCKTGTPAECSIRDMNDGRNAMDDYIGVTVGQDSGGVHLNSTIFSGALWDMREQLDPRTLDKVVYKALTEYMTPLDTFMDGRNAVVAAAIAMDLGLADVQKITAAFDGHMIHKDWEHHLGIDSRSVLPNVTSSFAAPSAREGRWVLSNSDATGAQLPSVYTGRTDGKGTPRRLSPDDGRWHEFPATDGTYGAWMAIGEDGGAQSYDVLTRRLDSGKPRSVFASASVQPEDIVVDGYDVAFTGWDFTTGESAVHLARGGKTAKKIALPKGHQAWGVDMREGTLVWTEYWQGDKGLVFAPTVYDIKRGKVIAQYPPQDPSGEKASLIGATRTVGDRVLWTERAQGAGTKTAIRSGALDGSGIVDVVPADAPYAPVSTAFTASDEAVTYVNAKGGQEWTNENLAKLHQVPLGGGAEPVRVSCNRGTQVAPAADSGTEVLWIDGTGGQTDLVTRPAPAGTC